VITRYTIEITAQCAACGTKDHRSTITEHTHEAMQAKGPSGFRAVWGGTGVTVELCKECSDKAHLVVGDFSLPLFKP
jgi:hypothetical protein